MYVQKESPEEERKRSLRRTNKMPFDACSTFSRCLQSRSDVCCFLVRLSHRPTPVLNNALFTAVKRPKMKNCLKGKKK